MNVLPSFVAQKLSILPSLAVGAMHALLELLRYRYSNSHRLDADHSRRYVKPMYDAAMTSFSCFV